jgi:hypothetical protein
MDKVVLGALVADAASLGFHWIYSPERIKEIVGDGTPEFHTINEEDYHGVPSYFAHGLKVNGDLSQYGEMVKLFYEYTHKRKEEINQETLKEVLYDFFQPGGRYVGYVDKVINHLVYRITGEQISKRQVSFETNLEDDQNTVFTLFAPLTMVFDGEELLYETYELSKVITVHKDIYDSLNAVIQLYGMLKHNENVVAALKEAAQYAPSKYQKAMLAGLDEEDYIVFAKASAGLSCHLNESLPVVWNILAHATSYEDGVRKNILLGGDSCGRSIILGSLLGLIYDIPDEWVRKVNI